MRPPASVSVVAKHSGHSRGHIMRRIRLYLSLALLLAIFGLFFMAHHVGTLVPHRQGHAAARPGYRGTAPVDGIEAVTHGHSRRRFPLSHGPAIRRLEKCVQTAKELYNSFDRNHLLKVGFIMGRRISGSAFQPAAPVR